MVLGSQEKERGRNSPAGTPERGGGGQEGFRHESRDPQCGAEEKYEKKGAAERNQHILTLVHTFVHFLAEGTECKLW